MAENRNLNSSLSTKIGVSPTSSASPSVFETLRPDRQQAIITTDRQGLVLGCGPRCRKITGHNEDELIGRHISTLIPKLSEIELLRDNEINPRLTFQSRCGIPYLATRNDGTRFPSELIFLRLGGNTSEVKIIIRNLVLAEEFE